MANIVAMLDFEPARTDLARCLGALGCPWPRRSLLLLLCIAAPALVRGEDLAAFFESRIRPVLAKHCSSCHGPAKMGGLEMKSRDALLAGGASGPAVVPGAPDDSLLYQAVSGAHERLAMPPQSGLPQAAIADLRRWIETGAVWPDTAASVGADSKHRLWSLEPIRKPALSHSRDSSWAKTPIDELILARLREERLKPNPPADRRTLLRRAYYDLIGLPPTPEQVRSFLADDSPDAFANVIEQLLASPHYGERWGRYWLDLARYSDDKLNIVQDEPYPNAFRYRDWVIRAFNEDMPYNDFVRAQIAADQLPVSAERREELLPALGFYGMSAQYQEDRPDVTGKVFLGLTVGCAACHDHKFDPIPTRDYYSMLGVFKGTKIYEHPLAPAPIVEDYDQRHEQIEKLAERLAKQRGEQARRIANELAQRIESYVFAAWRVLGPEQQTTRRAADEDRLDVETLERWIKYLEREDHTHQYLDSWQALITDHGDVSAARQVAAELEKQTLAVHAAMSEIEDENLAILGDSEGNPALAKLVLKPYPRDAYVFWTSLFGETRTAVNYQPVDRVLYYADERIDRFLDGKSRSDIERMAAELAELESALLPKYPFLHIIQDVDEPKDMRIHIRGSADNLGDVAVRSFLTALSDGPPKPFEHGSGRRDLAEAIVEENNPLTARVMVNRIWQHHFGRGLVRTPSNFGSVGEPPTHPKLLDYLGSRFIESGWSIKAMHRQIMLSTVYSLSSTPSAKAQKKDPDNRLLWRANLRRLDIEALRDSLLIAAGNLDAAVGGPPRSWSHTDAHRRTVYNFVSRRKLESTLALFDFPSANDSAGRRVETQTPLQGLFLLNSDLVLDQSKRFAERLAREAGKDDSARIRRAYSILFGRSPEPAELEGCQSFLAGPGSTWPQLAQVLLASNEFQFVP